MAAPAAAPPDVSVESSQPGKGDTVRLPTLPPPSIALDEDMSVAIRRIGFIILGYAALGCLSEITGGAFHKLFW